MSGKTEAPGDRPREDRPVNLIASSPSGEWTGALIPPGEYFLGDPCYVLGDSLYGELHELIFPPGSDTGLDVTVEVTLVGGEKATIFDFRTKHGDGRYPYRVYAPEYREQGSVRGEGLAVDSGGLALVDRRLVQKIGFDDSRLATLGTFVTFKELTRIDVRGGNLCAPGLLEVWTDPPQDDDY
jgi:hypothetical protein